MAWETYTGEKITERGDDTTPRPGENPAAVTDPQIAQAVQAVNAGA